MHQENNENTKKQKIKVESNQETFVKRPEYKLNKLNIFVAMVTFEMTKR